MSRRSSWCSSSTRTGHVDASGPLTRWSVEQGLAWIMWRDDARVSETGDGRLGTILPRDTAQATVLGETGTDEIERRLLETGSVDQQWPDSAMGPYPRRERLVTSHE